MRRRLPAVLVAVLAALLLTTGSAAATTPDPSTSEPATPAPDDAGRAHRGAADRGAGRARGAGADRARHHALPAGDRPRRPRCWSRTASAAARPRSTPTPGTWPPAGSSCWPGRPAGSGASGGQIALDSPDYEVADAPRAGRLAGRAARGRPGRARRPAGRRHRRLLRRCALAAAGRLRPPGGRAGPGDHLERPGAGPVPERRGGAPRRRWTPRRAGRSPRTGCSSPAGPGSSSRPGWGRRRPGRTPARAGAAPAGGGLAAATGAAWARPDPARRPTRTPAGAPTPPPAPARRPAAGSCPAVCTAYTEAATTGRLSPGTAELLRRSSPASVTDRITAPTLLVQGEQDTLFGLDQADANARQIAATGAPVKVVWFAGGHDGGRIGHAASATRSATGSPGTSAGTARWPTAARTRAPASPTPCRAGSAPPAAPRPAAPWSPPTTPACPARPQWARQTVALQGDPQVVIKPAGGNPAAITSLPGLGGALGSVGGRLTAITAELPGQSAQFRSAPLAAPLLSPGAPRVAVSIARLPGQPAPAEAVLFAKTYEVTPDGLRTLLGSAVAPMRVAVPADGLAGRRSPSRCPAWWRRSRPATGCWSRSPPPTRATPAPPIPRSGGSAGRRRGQPCRWCPASR